jgi:hypothetical protein
MPGIQETKEAAQAIGAMYSTLKELAADGIQWSDAQALAEKLASDPELMAKIDKGIKGFELIESEMRDLNFFEGLELFREVTAIFKR